MSDKLEEILTGFYADIYWDMRNENGQPPLKKNYAKYEEKAKKQIRTHFIEKDKVRKALEKEKPSKEFLPQTRGFTEALNADVRNDLRDELIKELEI